MFIQIAIDGPGGVGKSTLAKALSEELGYLYINTGFIFRGLAWYLLKYPELTPEEALRDIAAYKLFIFKDNSWFFRGKKIEYALLKQPEITKKTSEISKISAIRSYVLIIERELADKNNVIMEGRDIGTTVFPKAQLKIFLTADSKTRAARRYEELKSMGLLDNRTLEDIQNEQDLRDKEDSNRDISPLKKAEDAIEINSTEKSVQELVVEIKQLLQKVLYP